MLVSPRPRPPLFVPLLCIILNEQKRGRPEEQGQRHITNYWD